MPAPGPMDAVCWARLELLQGRRSADVSFSVDPSGMAPALLEYTVITGHGGQGPDLALSGCPNLDSTREKKSLPTKEPPASPPRVQSRPSLPPSCRPARQPRLPVQGTARFSAVWPSGPLVLWSCSCGVALILPGPGRAWSSWSPAGPGWSSTSPSDPLPDRGQTLATHTLTGLVMGERESSSQHIQEVSRRARWSHLANERSISTSKGPPPPPAKARLDAMLLLGPCLFPSPPPCPHPSSLTTNC